MGSAPSVRLRNLYDRVRCYFHGRFVEGDELEHLRDELVTAAWRRENDGKTIVRLTNERDMARHDVKIAREDAAKARRLLLESQSALVVAEAELATKKAAEG